MFSGLKGLLAFLLIISFSEITFSASSSGGSKIGPSVGAMVLFGQGKMGNDSDAPSRSMIYTPIVLFGGFNIKQFRIGLNYEYNLAGQSDDPSGLANQNLGGKGSSVGLRLEYYNGKSAFGLIYHVSDKYTLDKATISGATSEYEGKSGIGIQYYRQIKKKLGIVLDYSMGEMKSTAAIPNTNDIKYDRIGIGLVFTNFASSK